MHYYYVAIVLICRVQLSSILVHYHEEGEAGSFVTTQGVLKSPQSSFIFSLKIRIPKKSFSKT